MHIAGPQEKDVGHLKHRGIATLYPLARWTWHSQQMTCSLLLPSSFSASLPVSLLHPSSAPPVSPRASWDFLRLPWVCSGRLSSVALGLVRSGRGEAETMDRRGCGAQALSEIAFARSLALEGLCYLLQVIEYSLFHCSRHSYPG